MSKNAKQCSSSFYCDKYGDPYKIQIELMDENNYELIFSDCCGEPEDNDYGRDHADVLDVPTLLQKFYQILYCQHTINFMCSRMNKFFKICYSGISHYFFIMLI